MRGLFDLQVSISYKLLVLAISPGNVVIMLTHQILIILKMESNSHFCCFFVFSKILSGLKQVLEYNPWVKGLNATMGSNSVNTM